MHLCPLLITHPFTQGHADVSKILLVAGSYLLTDQSRFVNVFFYGKQDLLWVNRFNEII